MLYKCIQWYCADSLQKDSTAPSIKNLVSNDDGWSQATSWY